VFEETMRTYARLIRQAIASIDDPMDRLTGAMVAAVRLAEISGGGVDRGLARLRLKLAEVEPEMVGRAQAVLTSLIRGLVVAASTAGGIEVDDPDAATFVLLALNAAYITTGTLGNDAGAERPEPAELVGFCLTGLGADLEAGWYDSILARLELPAPPRSARRAAAKDNG